jgi:ribonucleoside-diphosphate reductase alpha chain
MSNDTLQHQPITIQKRNGQVVNFNPRRIKSAIENAFKDFRQLPRESELSVEEVKICQRMCDQVLAAVESRSALDNKPIYVEDIQDEVVRTLFESGYRTVADLYANYRKQHAERRRVFELFTVTKRDGKVVSFKPEKIALAVANAFRTCNQGVLTEVCLQHAKKIAHDVVTSVQETWPEGRCVHIEEIQDLVEKNLLKAGFHDVVRQYIQYREEHARLRRQREVEDSHTPEQKFDWVNKINFVDNDGQEKPIHVEEIRFLIEECCDGIKDVKPEVIFKEAAKNYYHGIKKDDIGKANIMAAKSFIEREPNYSFVAARLLLLSHYAQALGRSMTFTAMRSEYPVYFAKFIRKAVELELLSADLLKFDLELLGHTLDAKRDFSFRYMGLQILHDRYFIHWDGVRIELPQIFWMRVAMGLAKNEGAQRNERAVEFYHMLSTYRFTSSTPTLFNSGTRTSQLSSCFLTTIEDDLHHIFKCIQDDAMLSKWSGGLGNDWTNVRAMGSRIHGTNGRSQGVIPFLKVANDTALAVNQGGKRQGAMCAYLEVWHLDIEEFLDLRKTPAMTVDERTICTPRLGYRICL